ncbi:MAG: rod-binding protein [Pseudobacteriovorax sp.]|nr:rod-binding protein [Pseudobacteriovorax sp.]
MEILSRTNAKYDLSTDEQTKENINNAERLDEISELSAEFESIFLGIVLKSMRDSVPRSEFISGGNGEEIFRSMLDTEYAKSMAHQRSTGLADAIENHLRGLNQPVQRSLQVDQRSLGLSKYMVPKY